MTLTRKHKVLLTGLEPTSVKAASFVREMKADAIIYPLQKTILLNPPINGHYDWCIFTSPASVRHFFESDYVNCFSKAACIGPSTKKTLEAYNIHCDLMPKDFNSKSLVQLFSDIEITNLSILYPCSAQADDTIEHGMTQMGNIVCRVNTYKLQAMEKGQLPDFDDVIFFSTSAVKVMFNLYGAEALNEKRIAAIGDKTASAVKEIFGKCSIQAAESTAEATVRALLSP